MLMWIFIVLAHLNNISQIDMSLNSDTLFWYRANQSYSTWYKYLVTTGLIFFLSPNWTFSLRCVLLIKSGSLNWPWSTKNIRWVCNLHAQELALILKKTHLTSPIKTITPVSKILTYIITSITSRPVWLAAILMIISVSTVTSFK